ncbi:MAG: asparagine synthase (glutamine-hydrolyzing) [Acidobacteria bacterium]|nr:asparagine synthase (glutamine-hydrolyzing) [Acidobacteriota bacterium]
MCGLAGIAGRQPHDPERARIVREMTRSLAHRGPDGEGFAHPAGCDLGFRRLAIVDLEAPSPPQSNEAGNVWSVCNGEIYNAPELVAWLQGRGHVLRSSVDTEVIPHLYEELGPGFAERLDGMFAFAVWDESARTLVLGRDRAGEKPLFYWTGPGELVFASELRALLEHPRVPRALDPLALGRYLLHDYFPAPLTPLAGVRKLPAAHVLLAREGQVELRRYWDLAPFFGRGAVRSYRGAARELDRLIGRAVERRKRGDVQVGVFLSGGIDSSAILAHLAEQEGPGIPAFSIGHADPAFDESRFARETAERFGAQFEPLVLGEAELEDGLALVGDRMDEPLADASTIPCALLARHARQKVKVVLSGEGSDELFAGYPTYIGHRVAGALAHVPAAVRRRLVGAARGLAPVSMGNVGLDYLVARFADAADRDPLERHHSWFGSVAPLRQRQLLAPAVLAALDDTDPFGSARATAAARAWPDLLSTLLYTDFTMYLQDDLLTKVDRTTMLSSLESRAPFLDHELAEWVAALPSSWKLRRTRTKAILRRALRDRLPREVLERRKRGFNIPFSRWLLHGLGDRLRERFSAERVAARGLFRPAGVSALLDEHLSRRADHRKPLFSLLALDLWCDRTYGAGCAVPLAGEPTPAQRAAVP